MYKKNKRIRIIIAIILAFGAIVTIFPFVWMILTSFKMESEVARIPPTFLPENPTLDNYYKLFKALDFGTYLKNTLIIVLFSFVGMLFNAMAGYGFAKYEFKGKNFLFFLVLATMMIPGQVIMIPIYMILNSMKLTNTLIGIVLPGLVGAFSIFLFRQFMSNISNELIEAARLDGASEFYIFFKLILPVSKPILAVQGILTFIAGWNSFLWPLILANDEKYYTLSVGLSLLKGQYENNYTLQMAGAALMVVPIIIVFLIFQKHILEGFDVSGHK